MSASLKNPIAPRYFTPVKATYGKLGRWDRYKIAISKLFDFLELID